MIEDRSEINIGLDVKIMFIWCQQCVLIVMRMHRVS
jgi:hypothetical protein